MKVLVSAKTFRSVNFGPFWLAGKLLEEGAPDFGQNPAWLMIRPHFRNDRDYFGMPGYLDAYHERLKKLPRVRVLNKGKQIEIEYVSNICKGDDFEGPPTHIPDTKYGLARIEEAERVHGPHPPARPYDAELLRRLCAEMLEILPSFRKRMAKVEHFDFDRFIEWATLRFKELPSSDDAVKAYEDAWLAKQAEPKSPESWDDLLIDWSKYHPLAREVLDDLFYWDCVNECAPHGNDEGADLLEQFLRWRKGNKGGDSKKFFERLMGDWGVLSKAEVVLPDMYEPSIIGLAFAHLKVDATCPSWVRDEALKILRNNQSNSKASENDDEVDSYQNMMIEKLEEF